MKPKFVLFPLLFCLFILSGCMLIPGQNAGGKAELSFMAVSSYLANHDLDKPEIIKGVLTELRKGERYRKRVKDRSGRYTTLTVWLDKNQQDLLHVVTKRDQTCPTCNGTGKRDWKNPTMKNLPFDTRCLTCEGKGYLRQQVNEARYFLSAENFKDAEAARKKFEQDAYRDAPADTSRYVDLLASEEPSERLAACIWLDQNYVREGFVFKKFQPMLAKARWREQNEKKKIMVYQFWAGKDIKGEEARAYYRIYVDLKSGKVKDKGFYP